MVTKRNPKGAGRKRKADEVKLIDRLDSIISQDEAIESLKKEILKGSIHALRLYMSYRFGLPKNITEIEVKNKSSKEEILAGITPLSFFKPPTE